jgi:hypothetical protein
MRKTFPATAMLEWALYTVVHWHGRISGYVRFGSKADMCSAKRHVRFTPNSDRESGFTQTVMSALPPKADMCGARGDVCFGPKADIDNQVDQLVSAWKNMKQLEIRGRQLSRTATKLSTGWAYGPTSNICRMQIG